MTPAEALREVESLEFSARVNLASNLPLFLRAASEEAAVAALVGHLQQDPELRSNVLTRFLELARVGIDLRYRHPSDAALAVYLWLLDQIDAPLGAVAAEAIAQTPHCWWAARVATPILLRMQNQSSPARDDIVTSALGAATEGADSFTQSGSISESVALAGVVRARSAIARFRVVRPQSFESLAA